MGAGGGVITTVLGPNFKRTKLVTENCVVGFGVMSVCWLVVDSGIGRAHKHMCLVLLLLCLYTDLLLWHKNMICTYVVGRI